MSKYNDYMREYMKKYRQSEKGRQANKKACNNWRNKGKEGESNGICQDKA